MCRRVIELTVPVRVEAVANAGTRRGFDRRGRVVTGVVTSARKPVDVTRVADQIRGNDRTDTMHAGDRRARPADRALDAPAELDQCLVVATDLVEELDRDPLSFDPDRVVGAELAEHQSGRFAERFLTSPPSIISASTACNRQIARVRAATSW